MKYYPSKYLYKVKDSFLLIYNGGKFDGYIQLQNCYVVHVVYRQACFKLGPLKWLRCKLLNVFLITTRMVHL